MFESFEYKGYWWLPGKENKKLRGILKFIPHEKIILELEGIWEDDFLEDNAFFKTLKPTTLVKHEIILGSTDYKEITLYQNTLLSSVLVAISRTPSSEYSPRYVFIGEHYNDPSNIKLSSLKVNFTYLEEWLGQSPFKNTIDSKTLSRHLDYTIPDIYEVRINPIDAILSTNYEVYSKTDRLNYFQYNHVAFLRITPQKFKDFEWFEDILDKLQIFLSLLTGLPIYPKKIIAYNYDKEDNKKKTITIYHKLSNPKIKEKIYARDIINFQYIKNDFEDYINNYFRDFEKLSPVYGLFLRAFYRDEIPLELTFLNLMKSIEAFHIRIRDPDKNKKLKARLKDLLADDLFWKYIARFIKANPKCSDKEVFIQTIIDARNYLTHYNPTLENKVIREDYNYNMIRRLKIFLSILLLNHIGIPLEKVFKLLDHHPYGLKW